jgi:hypothetical protein
LETKLKWQMVNILKLQIKILNVKKAANTKSLSSMPNSQTNGEKIHF